MANEIEFSLTRRGRRDNVEVGLGKWAEELASGMTVTAKLLPDQVKAYLAEVVRKLSAKHNNRWPGGGTGLNRRSGDLLSSLQAGIVVTGTSINDLRGSLGGVPYLTIQEYGGTLRARNTQYLAIPLPAALNSDGTPIHDDPRQWDSTFVQQSRAGNLLIFQRQGAGIIPLYALKSSVAIPARLGARQIARDSMPYLRSRVLDAVLRGLGKTDG